MDKRVALVTGASRGIGAAIAATLTEAGFFVVGTATSETGAEKISKALGAKGKGAVLNVCSAEQIKALVSELVSTVGAPYVLVNNAGITQDNIFLRMSEDQWQSVIDTNLTGVFRLMKLCLRYMLKARSGRIINITSVVGVTGNPGQANYCAAKAGLIGMTKSIALEYGGHGITANCVAPGFIETDMTRQLTQEQSEALLGNIPMKRMGTPEDIAAAVRFLAENSGNYVTGQTLHINGGLCMV